MSAEYYRNVREHLKNNQNYVRGRGFEYRVMSLLRKKGWHCMRRFGSHDEVVQGIGHVPLDVTAYKDGKYLLISCKYSIYRGTTINDDPKWPALLEYAKVLGDKVVPVLATINEDRKVKFTDLRTLGDLFYRMKSPAKDIDPGQMEKLIEEANYLISLCKDMIVNAKDEKTKNKWANTMAVTINVLQRILYRAGMTASSEDIASLFTEEEKKVES